MNEDCAICRVERNVNELYEIPSVRRGKVCSDCKRLVDPHPISNEHKENPATEEKIAKTKVLTLTTTNPIGERNEIKIKTEPVVDESHIHNQISNNQVRPVIESGKAGGGTQGTNTTSILTETQTQPEIQAAQQEKNAGRISTASESKALEETQEPSKKQLQEKEQPQTQREPSKETENQHIEKDHTIEETNVSKGTKRGKSKVRRNRTRVTKTNRAKKRKISAIEEKTKESNVELKDPSPSRAQTTQTAEKKSIKEAKTGPDVVTITESPTAKRNKTIHDAASVLAGRPIQGPQLVLQPGTKMQIRYDSEKDVTILVSNFNKNTIRKWTKKK